jgi:hypothetical protein
MTTMMTLLWPVTPAHVAHAPTYNLSTYLQSYKHADQRSNLQANQPVSSPALHPTPHHRGYCCPLKPFPPLLPEYSTTISMTYHLTSLEKTEDPHQSPSTSPTTCLLLNQMKKLPQDSPLLRDAPSTLSPVALLARSPTKLYFTSLTLD